MTLKKKMLAGALGVLAMGGIGAGVANAATTAPAPAPPSATSSPTPGVNTHGDTGNVQQGDQTGPDTTGAVDKPEPGEAADKAGAVDTPEPGEAADKPGAVDKPGAGDTDNVQQGQQSGPDNGGAKGSVAPQSVPGK